MALTLNAPVSAAVVSPGAFVVGVLDGPTNSRLFAVPTFNGQTSTAGPTGATFDPPSGVGGLPTVGSVTQITALDSTTNTQEVGQVRLNLIPNAGDVINASSPEQFVLSANALVLTATAAS